ncbi:hypothetical protein [Algoriphagus sp. CAU 1675]|uniref:hypothetical protein n=1 Tax=Algoriphagus sp. CAU 1675 TaxID=3032597 RepID=UPI0023DA44DF|nr:hypothetical protein [Algoriphagus sp. CAU 1675]MDF2158436.1 hypothetical protein [Algoriphagus sp. CAU 1675]
MKSLVRGFRLFWIAVPLFLSSCHPSVREGMDEKQFANYWYQGKAEINVFDLKQSRYGEERSGQAVMIFVTEDFSKRKQVKVDQPENAGKDAKKALKLNMTREFVTGVYPYHTMLSIFTPVTEEVNSLKITSSVTEWCGQAFTQLNWKNNAYQGQLFSYFESEGDQQIKIDAKAEDELFNLIRLNPDLLPTGDVRLIPGLTFQRLSHIPLKAERATVSVNDLGSNQSEVEVAYKEIGRTLTIRFEKFFPYEILFWQEGYTREDGKVELTTATRSSMQMMDYWNKNGKEFEPLRKELGL